MKVIHDLIQGSDAWLQFRATHFGSSEAAAMLGLSKTTTRTELLRLKKTGISKEFSDWVQANVLDYGHEVEALARPHVESIIGADLYAVTCSDGELSASCDGLTMDDETAFEHKQWNEIIAAIVRGGNVPDEHIPQCQQILMVTKAGKLIFVVSDGTPEKMVWAEVFPDPVWFDRIKAGWAQFAKDLATYTPVEAAPVAIGRAPKTLPALHIVLKGEVSASNLDEFKQVALTAIRSVNRDLQTDQDFADSAKARKWCQDIEDRVAAAKGHALSQTATIDTLFRALDEVSAEAATVRIALEKLEKARTQSLNEEIVFDGKSQFAAHMTAHNAAMPAPYMPQIAVDFGVSIKGLRTVASKRNAVSTELARVKIIADGHAARIQANLKTLAEKPDMDFLFSDKAHIVLKAADDLQALVINRIAEHERKEAARLEAEREKIRAEEQAKAEAAVREAEQVKAQAAAKLAFEAEAAEKLRAAKELAVVPISAPVLSDKTEADKNAIAFVDAVEAAGRVLNVVPLRAAPVTAAVPSTPPTLKLGEISDRLGFALTGDFLKSLGFEPAARDKSALLFHEAEFGDICAALVSHIQGVQVKRAA